MRSTEQIRTLVLLLFGFAATGATAWAQDQQEPPSEPSKPKPAGRGIPGIGDTTEDNNNQNDQWRSDHTPLTGLANPTLGFPEMRHSYWVPGISYGSSIRSGATNQGWYVDNYVGANVSLLQAWSRNELALNYTGGGFFTTANSQNNGTFQILSLADTITLNRWQIQFFNSFSYLPVSSFGFFGGTGIGIPGVAGSLGASIPGLAFGIVPNQSVFSASGPRYSNVSAAQVTYALSRHGSITAAGSYGFLRFTQAENVDNSLTSGSVGYNYALTKDDSIGVFYRFTGFHYSGQPQAIGTNVISAIYSRILARKLALTLYGGPQFVHYRVPVGTQSKTTNAAAGAFISYATEQAGITGFYFHGLSGGSGVLVGSFSDSVGGGLNHRFGRVWNAKFNFGYVRNSALGSEPVIGSEPGIRFRSFNNWFAGASVSRPFGRDINFVANYTAYFENIGGACTTATPCNTSYTRHSINLSIHWHSRPFVLP